MHTPGLSSKINRTPPRPLLNSRNLNFATNSPAALSLSNSIETFNHDDASIVSSVQSLSSSTGRQPLPNSILKQLATDIETAGGIDQLQGQKLKLICNKDPTTYGNKNDPIRSRIRKKVQKWKQLSSADYVAKVLTPLHVKRKTKNGAYIKYDRKKALQDCDDISIDSVDSDHFNDTIINEEQRYIDQTPIVPTIISSHQIPTKIVFAGDCCSHTVTKTHNSDRCNMMTHVSKGIPRNTEIINVDIKHPERNGPFLIFESEDILGKDQKSYYHGFDILFLIDARWINDNLAIDAYKARLFTDNQILVTVPAWPYSVLLDYEQLDKTLPARLTGIINHSRHLYKESDGADKFKHILLQFPDKVNLSISVLNATNNDDHELVLNLASNVHPHSFDQASQYEIWGLFTVAREDKEVKKRGKVDGKSMSKSAALMAAFSMISLNPSGTTQNDGSGPTVHTVPPSA